MSANYYVKEKKNTMNEQPVCNHEKSTSEEGTFKEEYLHLPGIKNKLLFRPGYNILRNRRSEKTLK
jgi:hypothetical protein